MEQTNFHSNERSPPEETSTSQATLEPPRDAGPLFPLGAGARFLDWFHYLSCKFLLDGGLESVWGRGGRGGGGGGGGL